MTTKKIEIDWKTLFVATFKAFPKIWWRMLIVNMTVFLMIIAGSAVIVGLGILLFGGFGEGFNVFQNLAMTGNITINHGVILGLLFLLWLLIIITFGTVGKIANMMVVKDYTKKKTTNPRILYFQESWKFFWRYILVGFRVFAYLLMPIMILFAVILFIPLMALSFDSLFSNVIIAIVGILAFISAFVFALYLLIKRSLNAAFAHFQLIEKNGTPKEAFDGSLALVKGNWGKVFVPILLSGLIIVFFPTIIFNALSEQLNQPIFTIIGELYSFVFVAPFMMSFVYFLMLSVAKVKKIK